VDDAQDSLNQCKWKDQIKPTGDNDGSETKQDDNAMRFYKAPMRKEC
jgi:hypothetical protein